MDLELDKLLTVGMDADGFTSRAEIIPLVTKEDESFLLYEDEIPDDMPLLPLRDNVLFPGVVMPITIGRKSSLQLLRLAERKNMRIVVVAQKNDAEEPSRQHHGCAPGHHEMFAQLHYPNHSFLSLPGNSY